jgi:Cu-Zn family superoxide dismutase
MSTHPCVKSGLVALLAASLTGCLTSERDPVESTPLATSSGPWMIYSDPWVGTPMAGTPNPITTAMTGTATAVEIAGKMTLTLSVSGLPPNRAFGSHLHKLDCADPTKAGGHYENENWPAGGSASDPRYANSSNEAWLDFTTDASGNASPSTTVNWVPRAGAAKAIIIHAMGTMVQPMGGLAGVKLACLPIAF